ncbi:MAG: hypothetical protein M1838_001910 [Thelocarpon superellum]|nr:MAG: hypothetical protein M1838_001910 [Thelocarpon superellum]
MATKAHCLYCFDTLSSSLEHRTPLKLQRVQELWEQYNAPREMREAEPGHGEEAEIEGQDLALPTSGKPRTGFEHLMAPRASSASSSSTPASSSGHTPLSAPDSSANSSTSSSVSLGRTSQTPPTVPDQVRPLFVTWNTINRSGSKSLRGCIGTFEAQEVGDGLRSYALTSAFSDSRFAPITRQELPHLEVGVTLLTDFEHAATPTSWDLGTHGLRISFHHRARRYGATYLPDVAVEQGWSKEETLVSLMRKAGWDGGKDDWDRVGDLEVVRYQGKKESMTYSEWLAWREWVDRNQRA